MKSIITDISFCECVDSAYVKPRRMLYMENGAKRSWDFIHSLDSVSVLLYHTQKQSLLFVKQFRPPVFVRHFGESHLESGTDSDSKTFGQDEVGYTYELCAGLVDKKGKSVEQIAKEEVEEECGYKVNSLEYITSFATAVGHSGAKQSLFYAEINENDRVSTGGGIDGEVIESVFVKVEDLEQFLYDESKIKTPGLAFGVMWFLRNKRCVNK